VKGRSPRAPAIYDHIFCIGGAGGEGGRVKFGRTNI
jgi:hypothetical protein